MAYEIEFIGVKEETKDATAICMRWLNADGTYTIGVFDGGTSEYGEVLKRHLQKYYFDGAESGRINFVVCSHPHLDHASGLSVILENFDVDELYMNRPWVHVDSLFDKTNNGHITKESLKRRLKEKYKYISALEEIAEERGIPIYDAFEGGEIAGKLTVLSPSEEFYLDLLVESDKTPLEESDSSSLIQAAQRFVKKVVAMIWESWDQDSLREDVSTEPDNETSTILLGEMDEEAFLLTGDVGIRGLRKALDYADGIGKNIRETVTIYEIPHHGGRHNVSPSILNEMLGEIVDEGTETDKRAFVCTGKGTDHPKQMVVNAFRRRGARVYNASGSSVQHHVDLPLHPGWGTADPVEFDHNVEEWT